MSQVPRKDWDRIARVYLNWGTTLKKRLTREGSDLQHFDFKKSKCATQISMRYDESDNFFRWLEVFSMVKVRKTVKDRDFFWISETFLLIFSSRIVEKMIRSTVFDYDEHFPPIFDIGHDPTRNRDFLPLGPPLGEKSRFWVGSWPISEIGGKCST